MRLAINKANGDTIRLLLFSDLPADTDAPGAFWIKAVRPMCLSALHA